MDTPVTVSMTMTEDQAQALAQFVKRVGWSEFRINAVNENEATTIRSAVDVLQTALAEAGYAPR